MSTEVPRTLVLLRHAKADWPDVADLDRPLADRGRREAPETGEWLARSGRAPHLTMCSTAVRTRETWKLVVPHLSERPRTVYEDRLYEASAGEIIALLNELPDDVREVLVIGHNPGMHDVAHVLAPDGGDSAARAHLTRGFPTAGAAVLGFTGTWKSLEPGTASLQDFWAPAH